MGQNCRPLWKSTYRKKGRSAKKIPVSYCCRALLFCVKLIISIGAHRSRGGRHGAGCTGCRAVEGKKGKTSILFAKLYAGNKFKFNGEKKRQSIPSIIEFGIFSQFSLRPKLGIANLNQYHRVWQAAKKPLEKYANLYKEKRRRSAHLKIKRFPFSPFLRTQKRRLLFLGVRPLGTLSVRNKKDFLQFAWETRRIC